MTKTLLSGVKRASRALEPNPHGKGTNHAAEHRRGPEDVVGRGSVYRLIYPNWPVSRSCKRGCTHFEAFHLHKPDIKDLRKFRCKLFIHRPKLKCDGKLDPRSELSTLIFQCKGEAYRFLLADGNTIAKTKDVALDEFPVSETKASDKFIQFDVQ